MPVLVNRRQLTMQLDTGTAVSIIPEETRKTLFADQKLRKSTHTHSNADGLSRLPLSSTDAPSSRGISIFNIGQVQALPVTFRDVQKATHQDKTLSKV